MFEFDTATPEADTIQALIDGAIRLDPGPEADPSVMAWCQAVTERGLAW